MSLSQVGKALTEPVCSASLFQKGHRQWSGAQSHSPGFPARLHHRAERPGLLAGPTCPRVSVWPVNLESTYPLGRYESSTSSGQVSCGYRMRWTWKVFEIEPGALFAASTIISNHLNPGVPSRSLEFTWGQVEV